MREEYVKSNVPFNVLCKHFGASPSEVKRYAVRQGWEFARKEYSAAIFKDFEASEAIHDNSRFYLLKRSNDAILAMLARRLEQMADAGTEYEVDELERIAKIGEKTVAMELKLRGDAKANAATDPTNPGKGTSVEELNEQMKQFQESEKAILGENEH